MSDQVVVALVSGLGAVIGALVTVWVTKRTTHQADLANRRTEAAQDAKTAIEGLAELVGQHRQDSMELRTRLENVEREMNRLKAHVGDLETERTRYREERRGFILYIRRLRAFIASLGHTPPEPDIPIDFHTV